MYMERIVNLFGIFEEAREGNEEKANEDMKQWLEVEKEHMKYETVKFFLKDDYETFLESPWDYIIHHLQIHQFHHLILEKYKHLPFTEEDSEFLRSIDKYEINNHYNEIVREEKNMEFYLKYFELLYEYYKKVMEMEIISTYRIQEMIRKQEDVYQYLQQLQNNN